MSRKKGGIMKNRAKYIRAQIINQLKSCVPNWSRLIRREKKRVAEEVLAEIVSLPEEKIRREDNISGVYSPRAFGDSGDTG